MLRPKMRNYAPQPYPLTAWGESSGSTTTAFTLGFLDFKRVSTPLTPSLECILLNGRYTTDLAGFERKMGVTDRAGQHLI